MPFTYKIARRLAVIGVVLGGLLSACTVEKNITNPNPPAPPLSHSGWHVSPAGSSSNDGSADHPWSLGYAVTGASGHIQPGDTVWLHGGTYTGQYYTSVAGTPGHPIVFREFPGERATIDVAGATSTTSRGDAFVVQGQWTEWWDFEMMSSDPNRYTTTRPNMMVNDASNTKYVDLVIHDGGIGFYNYPSASNVEFNGNIIYNNGWQTSVRGGGHALYIKSATGPVVLRDNVMFNQFGYGIHEYTDSGAGELINVTLDGNVAFNNGSLATQYNSTGTANILIGGEEPVSAARMVNNMTYLSPGIGINNLMIGYSTFANADVTMQNNYAVGGQYVLTTGYWSQVTASGNQLIGSSRVVQVEDTALGGYSWSNNSYRRDPAASGWTYNGTDYSFATWKANTGLGSSDQASSGAPSTPQVFVRASSRDPGRAVIVVYNWGNMANVAVDLSGILPAGPYEIRNVQNWFGDPVASGTYSGGAISIPMGGVAPPAVVGGAPHSPPQTGPDFDVFVVRSIPR
ncbi:MAG TPA: right-handed parallel beta-helix repeat-containing protein [Gemmatimonadales bacterium]|nr:right-handed parallel beta-helix repeat-containing protein [Gemmatimonadales bacterium]